MPFVLVLGGARSGKSAMAERLAVESRDPVVFIATGEARDEEMEARIRRHREDRPPSWQTVEAPVDLLAAIGSSSRGDFLVVDCLTLWVSNLLEKGMDSGDISLVAAAVARELSRRRGVVVSNEVGLGIVPANKLARTFRDTLGSVNATFAAGAERAVLLIAGRVLELGGADTSLRRD